VEGDQLSQLQRIEDLPEIERVTVPPGEFIMGHIEGYAHTGREDPAHWLTLMEYQIGRYPVTNAQYLPFLQDTAHPPPATWEETTYPEERADHPVSGVTWADAWLYCAWLRQRTGLPFHLPTEAQWEKAATWNPSIGNKQPYPWGEKDDEERCNIAPSGPGDTTPVTAHSPQGDSPYGCADMLGNVDEWCNTLLQEYPYSKDDGREESMRPGRRVARGGNWTSDSLPSGVQRITPRGPQPGPWGFRVALSQALIEAREDFVQRAMSRMARAEGKLKTRLARDQAKAQIWADLGGLYTEFGELGFNYFSSAEKSLTHALDMVKSRGTDMLLDNRLSTPMATLYYQRAYARFRQGKHGDALSDIDAAIRLNTTDADAYMLRAQIGCWLRRWERARDDWERAVRLKPRHGLRSFVEAQLYAGQEEYAEAIERFTAVIEAPLTGPLLTPEVHYWRGLLYEHEGRTEAAMSDYIHYLLWRPGAPEADRLTHKLARYRRVEATG
jgi:tetratricopeptide (TPR) repeat protein